MSLLSIERKNYPHLGQPTGPYVHAVKHNGVLYLSGLTAYGTPAQSGDAAEQVASVFEQISSIANAEGVDMSSLLKVTIFVTSLEGISALRAALLQAYGAALPAGSLLQVSALFAPELKVEVEALLAVS